MKKEIRYIHQKFGKIDSMLEKQKALYKKQGYLVITIFEGSESIDKGMKEVIRNHIF